MHGLFVNSKHWWLSHFEKYWQWNNTNAVINLLLSLSPVKGATVAVTTTISIEWDFARKTFLSIWTKKGPNKKPRHTATINRMAIVFLPNDNPPNNTTTNTPSEYDYTYGCAPTMMHLHTCPQWQHEQEQLQAMMIFCRMI